MIHVFAARPDAVASSLVVAALRRSVSHDLVAPAVPDGLPEASIAVCIHPDEARGEQLWCWLHEQPRKLILFGRLPSSLRVPFDVRVVEWPASAESWAYSAPAPVGGCAESAGRIVYRQKASAFAAAGWERALERFDFADEWNNLAYGAIRADGSLWALAEPLQAPEDCGLADLAIDGEARLTYCAMFEVGASSVLWFNRPVGPIDSFEWRLVERFLSNWCSDTQPCCPVISEIPWGHDSAITMRLDCDEDITSARPLWGAYRQMDVPLSLAIHSSNLHDDTHYSFLREFGEAGGAVLSHTATHAPNWGGSYEAALAEGMESRARIKAATGVSVAYAVSPFHQSPAYALAGLCDADYQGCIGGIIRNDPEFLLARGGELAGLPRGFIGHSQQTMLHGDCMLAEGDPLRIFKAAYDRAYEIRTLFGYLDHPFSVRYQYGWSDEAQRIDAHRRFIQHIRTRATNPLFMDEIQAMDFLRARAAIKIAEDAAGQICHAADAPEGLAFGVEFRNVFQPLACGTTLT